MLVIEYPSDCQYLFEENKDVFSSAHFGKKGNIVGTPDIAIAMMSITVALAPFFTKIILEMIKNKRKITIKYNGNIITGISEKTAEKIIAKMIKGDD
jgi:hypothetical protein